MKKITVMVFSLTLLLSSISVYANSNASEIISNWYKNAYQKSLESTTVVATDELKEIEDTSKIQQESLKEEISSKIESLYLSSISQTKSDIESHNASYQSRLKEVQAALEESNFEDFVSKEKAELETEITSDVEGILAEVLGE